MFHQIDFSVPAFSDRSITVTHSRMEDTYYDANANESSSDDEETEQELIDQERVYNINEVKAFLDEVCCMICFHVVSDPVCCEQCEVVYCKVCIKEWFLKSVTKQVCPCCRTDSQEYFNKNPFYILNTGNIEFIKNKPSLITTQVPKILIKLLSKLLLRCRNEDQGCSEVITYEFRQKHEKIYCGYAEVACPNHGCLMLVKRKDIQEHIDTDCQHTLLECRYCSDMIERCELENHLSTCDHKLAICRWCKDNQYLYELEKHEEQCSLRRVNCHICTKQFYLEKYRLHTPEVCYKQLWELEKQQKSQFEQEIMELKIKLAMQYMQQEQQQKCERNKQLEQRNKQLEQENMELKIKLSMQQNQQSRYEQEILELKTKLAFKIISQQVEEDEEDKIDDYTYDFEECEQSIEEQIEGELNLDEQDEEEDELIIKQFKKEFNYDQMEEVQSTTVCNTSNQTAVINWLDNVMNELMPLDQQ